jgi:hypothetical protein
MEEAVEIVFFRPWFGGKQRSGRSPSDADPDTTTDDAESDYP